MRTLPRSHILVCTGTDCTASGSEALAGSFEVALAEHGLEAEVKLVRTGCMGACNVGPVVAIYPDGVLYQSVTPEDASVLVGEHLLKGRPVERLLYAPEDGPGEALTLDSIPFFASQRRIALRNCSEIDPGDVREYIARDGYEALARAVTEMTPREVVECVQASGLRGRGGGGSLAGEKWEQASKGPDGGKSVVCVCGERDPGPSIDLNLLKGDPHSIIEGMAIAGYAIGARKGAIHLPLRAEAELQTLSAARDQACAYGLLADDLFGSGFRFDLHVGAGGAEFLRWEDGWRAADGSSAPDAVSPRAVIRDEDTPWRGAGMVCHAETLGNLAPLILNGPGSLASVGTEADRGTKVLALAGRVRNAGLVEVPMGTPLRTVVEEVGGGVRDGAALKAVLLGGPWGGCIPTERLDTPLDREALADLDITMGAGGLVVVDERTCMVDLAKCVLDGLEHEPCQACLPCRARGSRLLEVLSRITRGEGVYGDTGLVHRLSEGAQFGPLCSFGRATFSLVRSTVEQFGHEYEEHIREGRCASGACRAMQAAPSATASGQRQEEPR